MGDIPSEGSIDSLLQKVRIADDTLHDALAMAETLIVQQKEYAGVRLKLTATEEEVCKLKKRLDESEYKRTMQNQELRELKEEYQKLAEISEAEKQKCIEYDKCFRDTQLSNQEVINYKDSKIQYLENNTVHLQQKIESLEKILGDHNSKIREATELRIELENSRRKLNIAQCQLSQAERYSALVGSKLTDGNAYIPDLSDGNRPTKLAEKYLELYDNEWTEAFCGLTEGGKTEEMASDILAHVFCIIYSTCRKVADHDMVTFINATQSFYKVEILPKEIIKTAKDKRKRNPGNNSEEIKKCCGDDLKRLLSPEEQTRVSEYLQKSIEICWLMAIQDPPVFADTNLSRRDQKFNTAVYKPYTKSGEYIDFIVWPTLFLFEGGNVLCKGIAQGKKSRKTNQPYDNDQIIRKTQDKDVRVSLVPVSHPVSGSVRGTGYTRTVIRHDPGGRDNAMGPHTVYLTAPWVTVLKEGMNESKDSNRPERSAKSPGSEGKKYVSRINTKI